jgi:hypothetical protein
MATVSSDLLWELTKNNNAFLLKQKQIALSTDPYNLANLHSKKFAGIADTSAVGLSVPRSADVKKRVSTIRVKRLAKHGTVGKAGHEVTIKARGGVLLRVKSALIGKLQDRQPSLVKTAEKLLKRLNNIDAPRKVHLRKQRK